MQQVWTVLATLSITLVVLTICGLSIYFFRRRSEQNARTADVLRLAATAANDLRDAIIQHQKSIDSYLESTRTAVDPLKVVPAMIEGMIKIAAAQVKEIGLLRAEVKKLTGLIFKKDDVRGFEQPTDEDKSLVWDMQRILQENPNITRDAAIQEALDRRGMPREDGYSL